MEEVCKPTENVKLIYLPYQLNNMFMKVKMSIEKMSQKQYGIS